MPSQSGILQVVNNAIQQVPGWTDVVSLADSVSGATLAGRTVPGDAWELVLTARALFTTDATAGTRNPRFRVKDVYGNALYACAVSTGVAASSTLYAYLAINGVDDRSASGRSSTRWPDLVIQSGFTYEFIHDGVGAADSWSQVRFYVLRIPTDITRVEA